MSRYRQAALATIQVGEENYGEFDRTSIFLEFAGGYMVIVVALLAMSYGAYGRDNNNAAVLNKITNLHFNIRFLHTKDTKKTAHNDGRLFGGRITLRPDTASSTSFFFSMGANNCMKSVM